jgi:Bacteriophage KPP10, Structural protein ORF10
MATYSFLSIVATISGPGAAAFPLGQGAGVAEEGITVEMTAEKDTMTIGADGSGMHSLSADNSGKLTIRLLKTSPTNNLLSLMYNLQKPNPALWGQNIIVINDVLRGDQISAKQVAFSKHPNLTYAKEGGTVEWEMMAVKIDQLLGPGSVVVI